MGVIRFSDSPEGTWHVAGWAFDQILDDLIKERGSDTEIVDQVEQARLHSGLILYMLEPSLADAEKCDYQSSHRHPFRKG